MKKQIITYSQVGDNYDTKDPIKKLAQTAARKTAVNLKKHGFEEMGLEFRMDLIKDSKVLTKD